MKFPIPSDWDGETWCRWSVCWPDSELWRGFLRGLLTLPARGRTWDERTGSILDIQVVGREIAEANLPLVGVFMSCNDTELIASFNAIAAAIRYAADRQFALGCCGSGGPGGQQGIVGVVIQPVGGNEIPIYGTQPPAVLPDGADFPEGFEDLEQWQVHKCSVANVIIDGVLSSLSGLATLNLLNVNVLGVLALAAISGFLVFPPAAIPIMVGALLVLVTSQFALISARDYIAENREDFVCMLYEATAVNQVIGLLADALDTLVAVIGVSTPIGVAVKLILMTLFNSDAVNQLFDENADYQYPDADCSGCTSENLFQAMFNGPTKCDQLTETTFRAVERTDIPGRWEVCFAINHDPGDDTTFTAWVGPMASINMTILDGTVSFPDPPSPVRYFNQSSGPEGGGSLPVNPTCCAWVIVVSEFEFDIGVEDLGDC